MTKLVDTRKVKVVSLPSYPDVEIELYDGILTGEANSLKDIEDPHTQGLKALCLHIKSWSFVDENDKPIPIAPDALNKLPMVDVEALTKEVNVEVEKQTSKKKMS